MKGRGNKAAGEGARGGWRFYALYDKATQTLYPIVVYPGYHGSRVGHRRTAGLNLIAAISSGDAEQLRADAEPEGHTNPQGENVCRLFRVSVRGPAVH